MGGQIFSLFSAGERKKENNGFAVVIQFGWSVFSLRSSACMAFLEGKLGSTIGILLMLHACLPFSVILGQE